MGRQLELGGYIPGVPSEWQLKNGASCNGRVMERQAVGTKPTGPLCPLSEDCERFQRRSDSQTFVTVWPSEVGAACTHRVEVSRG